MVFLRSLSTQPNVQPILENTYHINNLLNIQRLRESFEKLFITNIDYYSKRVNNRLYSSNAPNQIAPPKEIHNTRYIAPENKHR